MYKLLKVILITLIFSVVLFGGCKKNKPPDIPSTPSGPTNGSINTVYAFASLAEDPNGDSVAIRFDWGDGDTSNWSKWVANGDSVIMFHSWVDSGSYFVKAQAKNIKDSISEWSVTHQVKIFYGWVKTFGDTWIEGGCSVEPTQDGGYIIVGLTDSYGAGNSDVYLIKTDCKGILLWFKTFGGPDYDQGNSVRQTSDGGYIIVGYTWSYGAGKPDVYLIKTDGSGNQQWYKTFGDSSWDEGCQVQQTFDGGFVIVGVLLGDVCLIKTDASGNQEWSKTFGDSSNYGYSAQQTTDGGYIITGYTSFYGAGGGDVYLIKTDSNGNQQWYKTYGGSGGDAAGSVEQTTDGGYIIAGSTESYDAGNSDIYLIKTDGNGNQQWYKTFGGSSPDWGSSVQQTTDGGYIIVGTSDGDVRLIKTDGSGNKQWSKTFGGSDWDYGYSVRQTPDGGYVIVGTTYSNTPGGDVYFIKTDENGDTE